MTEFERFKQNEGKLVGLLESSAMKTSENPDQRLSYRNRAAQLAIDYSLGTVTIDATTPEATIDQIYSAAISAQKLISTGFFHSTKKQIIDEAPLEKLAKGILNVNHVEVKGQESHNKAVKAIKEYMQIRLLNGAFDNDLPLQEGGPKVSEDDLFKIAVDYATQEVAKRLSPESKDNPDNKYLGDKEKKAITGAIISVIRTTPKLARMISGNIEKKKKTEYEALVKDDKAKAEIVRTSLYNNPKEDIARQTLYELTK